MVNSCCTNTVRSHYSFHIFQLLIGCFIRNCCSKLPYISISGVLTCIGLIPNNSFFSQGIRLNYSFCFRNSRCCIFEIVICLSRKSIISPTVRIPTVSTEGFNSILCKWSIANFSWLWVIKRHYARQTIGTF